MISTDFAPNETTQDGILGFKLLFQPWKWKKGKEVTKLRQRLRKRFFSDKTEVSFFLTGRSALYFFLKSLDLKKDSEVLVQAFTCEAVVLPILAQNVTPIYVDINKEDLSMKLEDLKKKYSSKAKVLILQHTFGMTPIQRNKILAFAKEKKLTVLEDLAHGFNPALFNNKNMTTSLLLSFGRSKSLSGVFGGAIVTKYKKISDYLNSAEKTLKFPSDIFLMKMALYKAQSVIIKALHDIYIGRILHKLSKYAHLIIPEISKKEKSGDYDIVYSKKLPNIAAIFILQQINRFNDVIKMRSSTSKYFRDKFRQSKTYHDAYLRYPFLTQNKNALLKKARKNNIYLGSWYDQVIAPKQINLSKVKYKKGSCPIAEQVAQEIVNLPTHITIKQAQQIVKIVKEFQ